MRGDSHSALAAFSDWLLAQPGVDTVTAEVRSDNAASVRVLEKSGFRRLEAGTQTYLRFARSR